MRLLGARLGILLGAVLLWLASIRCQPAPPASSLLMGLRILAIRVNPPEVPLSGTVALDALVVDADGGGRPVHQVWYACNPWRLFNSPEDGCSGGDAMQIVPGIDGIPRISPLQILARWPIGDGGLLPGGLADSGRIDGGTPTLPFPILLAVSAGAETAFGLRHGLVGKHVKRTNLRVTSSIDGAAPGETLGGGSHALAMRAVHSGGGGDIEEFPIVLRFYATSGVFAPPSLQLQFDGGITAPDGSIRATVDWEADAPLPASTLFAFVAKDAHGSIGWTTALVRSP